MEDKLTDGQTIFLEPLGNAARHSTEIIEATITKIGRKYFEVSRYGRFFIETMIQDAGNYSSQYKAYTNKKLIEDKKEEARLRYDIQHCIQYDNGITLDTLRKINSLIYTKVLVS